MNSEAIQRIRIPLGERFADLWLFVGDDRALLFDSGIRGTLESAVLPHLKKHSLSPDHVSHVVVSHLDVDHSGDVGAVKAQLPNAEIVAHQGDAEAISDWDAFLVQRGREFAKGWGLDESPEAVEWMRDVFNPGPVDTVLDSEISVDLGGNRSVDIWHVPGHSHGHLAIHDQEHDTLAISDAILGSSVPLADKTPSFPPTYRHVDAYLSTIERVRERKPGTLLTAHYGEYLGEDVSAFLNESELFVRRLDEAVKDAVGPEPQTLEEIVRRVNPVVATWPTEGTETALAFPVAGHLERAREAGEIIMLQHDDAWRWVS